jgi:hypothetical protein
MRSLGCSISVDVAKCEKFKNSPNQKLYLIDLNQFVIYYDWFYRIGNTSEMSSVMYNVNLIAFSLRKLNLLYIN